MLHSQGCYSNLDQECKDDINLLRCKQCNSGELDDQRHVILCTVLDNNKNSSIKYSDLFSTDLNTVKKAITVYEKSWNEMCIKSGRM